MIDRSEDMFDEKAAARIVGVHPRTLRRWREASHVAFYRTPTGRVRYQLADLVKLASHARVPANGRECP